MPFPTAALAPAPLPTDPSSCAHLSHPALSILHLHWHAVPDFAAHSLTASLSITYASSASVPTKTHLYLDTRDLSIHSVVLLAPFTPLSFTLLPHDPAKPYLGNPLLISLPDSAPSQGSIRIDYSTAPTCSALQWLAPSQTVGKRFPYLFSQCQAIHARSLLPCQDTPSVKVPYTATIQAPQGLTAVMSAIPTMNSKGLYHFHQPVPIPSYLIAFAVGNLTSREIGPRSTVWSEPEVIEKAAWEFAETEDFLSAGESILTPYAWGRYDLLVLPSSFPYGGMENPCLTFVTPTLLAGDRSLTSVIAHEIAHSWTGNLVTNANWQHFWLNEGFTVFVERKILSRLQGEPSAQFSSILGLKHLTEDVEHFGAGHPLTHLVPNLENTDPDDAFSSVPYEKGFNFLYYLQSLVGVPQFEAYLKKHIEKFAGKSITTDDWKSFLLENFPQLKDAVDWDLWLRSPGLPPVCNSFDDSLERQCASLAEAWTRVANGTDLGHSLSSSDLEGFTSTQKVRFLELLPPKVPIPVLERMDSLYGFSKCGNYEIKFRWSQIVLVSGWRDRYPMVVEVLSDQGRMKFTRPLFR